VDIEWKNGQLTHATIHNRGGKSAAVRYGKLRKDVSIKPGAAIHLDADLQSGL
jgi:hypothetical protein